MGLRRLIWLLIDLIFPVATPFTEQEAKREQELAEQEKQECETKAAALPDDTTVVTAYLSQCTALLSAEDERRRSVEGRLTSILGLSSIAGTIVFGGILAQASGTLGWQKAFLRDAMAVGALYLALQICSAILAAIRGLGRRGYSSVAASNILPVPKATSLDHLRTQVANYAKLLVDHRLQNNEKVSHMATAHRAMTNFFVALVIVACLGSYFAFTASPTNNLIQTLKTNHELNDLLRGPQGPKGDPGPPGPRREVTVKQLPPKPAK